MWNLRCIAMVLALGGGFLANTARAEFVDLAALGDDESDFVLFDHPFDLALPTRLHFVGTAESRKTPLDDVTGVRFGFITEGPNGSWITLGDSTDYIPLPPPIADGVFVSVPLELTLDLPSSPARVGLFIEGGGPADRTYVQGTFTHDVVPEPGTMALAAAATALLIGVTLRRSRCSRS